MDNAVVIVPIMPPPRVSDTLGLTTPPFRPHQTQSVDSVEHSDWSAEVAAVLTHDCLRTWQPMQELESSGHDHSLNIPLRIEVITDFSIDVTDRQPRTPTRNQAPPVLSDPCPLTIASAIDIGESRLSLSLSLLFLSPYVF